MGVCHGRAVFWCPLGIERIAETATAAYATCFIGTYFATLPMYKYTHTHTHIYIYIYHIYICT